MIQFVPQSVRFLGPCPSDEDSLLRRIELCGRVAYKSEEKITSDSAPKFVERMQKAGHLSVLEHSNIVLGVRECYTPLLHMVLGQRQAYHPITTILGPASKNFLIGGNVRAWLETLEHLRCQDDSNARMYRNVFGNALASNYPSIFSGLQFEASYYSANVISVVDQMHAIGMLPNYDMPVFTFKIVCDRGISHEIVRHRVMSFTQESTRYCNYSGSATFVLSDMFLPYWDQFTRTLDRERMPDNIDQRFLLYLTCYRDYRDDIKFGVKPQIARDVLPNLLKTEVYVSGRWSGWRHFIKLRSAPGAHPRIREIAREIAEAFETIGLKAGE